MKPTTLLIASIALGNAAFAGENNKNTIAPPVEDSWQFKLSMPGWVPWLHGDTGVNGQVAHIDLGPDNLVPKIDMAADFRMEARKGRLSVLGELFYMSISDGIGTETVVKKLDVQVDQLMGDLTVAWRVIESPRGYLDVVGGVRYTNFYQKVVTQANDERIDDVVDSLAAATRGKLRSRVANAFAALAGKDPTLHVAPLDADKAAHVASAIEKIRANGAARRAQIKEIVSDALDSKVSRTDDWWDPYVGVRARYNLNDKYYVSGKADIGGFGVGCDITWTAEAALGWKLSERVYSEIGYRAIGVDYDKDGLIMDTVTHGPQVNIGIMF